MEGSLFYSQKMGKAQRSNGKGDSFYGSNVEIMFPVNERYMMAALCRKGNMIQEEMT